MDNSYILYIIKVSIAVSMFYGIYMLFLRRDTFVRTKRLYLLFAMSASLLLPLCNTGFAPLRGNLGTIEALLPQIEVTPAGASGIADTEAGNAINFFTVIHYILMGGIVLLFSRFTVQLASILKIRMNNDVTNDNGTDIIRMNENIAPFSFFGWIFIPQNIDNQQEKSTMIAHEKVHARQNHSFDILFGELFCIFFWWNPVAWLVKREVCINLEYLADEEVINEGFDPKNYQYLLLKITNPNASISIINNFNVSQLKNRIIMINKEKTRKIFRVKYLLSVPVVALVLLVNMACFNAPLDKAPVSTEPNRTIDESPMYPDGVNQTPVTRTDDTEPYNMVEEMPVFPGGNNALLKFVSGSLKYPQNAAKNGIQGRVILRFVVTKTGDISDVSVLQGISADCDNEAVRVVKSMPKWKPGKKDGKDVAVYYTLPIRYDLGKKPKTNK